MCPSKKTVILWNLTVLFTKSSHIFEKCGVQKKLYIYLTKNCKLFFFLASQLPKYYPYYEIFLSTKSTVYFQKNLLLHSSQENRKASEMVIT